MLPSSYLLYKPHDQGTNEISAKASRSRDLARISLQVSANLRQRLRLLQSAEGRKVLRGARPNKVPRAAPRLQHPKRGDVQQNGLALHGDAETSQQATLVCTNHCSLSALQ